MHEKGYADFTVDHVISKVKKLKHKHKTECDKKRRSGRNRAKPWKFFESLDRILGTRANVQPPFLLDSSSVSTDEQLVDIYYFFEIISFWHKQKLRPHFLNNSFTNILDTIANKRFRYSK